MKKEMIAFPMLVFLQSANACIDVHPTDTNGMITQQLWINRANQNQICKSKNADVQIENPQSVSNSKVLNLNLPGSIDPHKCTHY